MMSNLNGSGSQSLRDGDGEDESLCLKIKVQLEKMFSDSHLAENGFLLKHVLKNKHGYVSLKLLTCLKKIKALTTNWHMTLAAAECSDLLELNDHSTKVKRKEPLPKWLLCSPTSRFLLVWRAPVEQTGGNEASQGPERASLLLKVLQKVGVHSGVTSVWILHPGEDLPKELQHYAKHHKELGQHLCAVVKFSSLEGVRCAYNALSAEEETSDGKGLCVAHMGFQSMQKFTKSESSEEKNSNQLGKYTCSQENPLEITKTLVKLEPSGPVKVFEETRGTYYPQACLDNSMERYFEKYGFQSSYELNQRYNRRNWFSGDHSKESPWVLRRKSAANAVNPKMMWNMNAPYLMQRVLRHPFGPDGTGGFYARRKTLTSLG